MIVLDRVRTAKSWNLHIPMYHRGHLSLYPGTTVYLAPVFRTDAQTAHFAELLGTQIQSRACSSVYRILVQLYDAPGVLHTTLEADERHGGNVLHLDSNSTEQEQLHEVEMVVDFPALKLAKTGVTDTCGAIEGLLLGDCCKHVVREADFKVRVRPITSLDRLHQSLATIRSVGDEESFAPGLQVERHGRITIPSTLQELLTKGMVLGESKSRALKLPFQYFVTSDTRDRVFRIFLVPQDEVVVWCAVRHADTPGAIKAVTGAIKEQGISILTALNRVQRHQGINWFELVLSKSEWGSRGKSQKAANSEVLKLLGQSSLREFQIEAFVDAKVADKEMRQTAFGEPRTGIWKFPLQLRIDDWLQEREIQLEELEAKTLELAAKGTRNNMAEQEADAARRQRLALRLGIAKVRRATGRARPQVFLSAEFSEVNKARIQIVRDCCSLRKVSLDVVFEARDQPVVKNLDRIWDATCFLAIWTPSEKNQSGGLRPSPWCLWEIGAANAYKKPIAVLNDSATDMVDYDTLFQEFFRYPFSAADAGEFKRKVEMALDTLLKSTI